jgi:hypothetical protein
MCIVLKFGIESVAYVFLGNNNQTTNKSKHHKHSKHFSYMKIELGTPTLAKIEWEWGTTILA